MELTQPPPPPCPFNFQKWIRNKNLNWNIFRSRRIPNHAHNNIKNTESNTRHCVYFGLGEIWQQREYSWAAATMATSTEVKIMFHWHVFMTRWKKPWIILQYAFRTGRNRQFLCSFFSVSILCLLSCRLALASCATMKWAANGVKTGESTKCSSAQTANDGRPGRNNRQNTHTHTHTLYFVW